MDVEPTDVADQFADGGSTHEQHEDALQTRHQLEERVADLTRSLVVSRFDWASETVLRDVLSSYPSSESLHDVPALQAEILRLLHLRNAHIPIHNLPNELLSQILWHIAHDADKSTICANHELVTASAVCRRWRRVAVDNPMLWTRIDLEKGKLTALAIERTGNALLDVSLTLEKEKAYHDYIVSDVTKPVVEHATRIGRLAFFMLPDALGSILGCFPPALPALRELELQAVRDPDADEPFRDPVPSEDHLRRASSISHSTLPALTTLTLRHVTLPWSLPLFAHLAEITITNENVHPSLNLFLDVLDSCSGRLRALHLVNAGPHDPTPPRDRARRIALPALHTLELRHPPGRDDFQLDTALPTLIPHILQFLVLPPTALLYTTVFVLPPPLLASLPNLAEITTLADIPVGPADPADPIHLHGTDSLGTVRLHVELPPDFDLRGHWAAWPALAALLTHLPALRTPHFSRRVRNALRYTSPDWAPVLAGMRAAEELSVYTPWMMQAAARAPLPALRALCVDGPECDARCVGVLRKWLETRTPRLEVLEFVDVRKEVLDPATVDRLRVLVGQVRQGASGIRIH